MDVREDQPHDTETQAPAEALDEGVCEEVAHLTSFRDCGGLIVHRSSPMWSYLYDRE
jgi:hypothetical protein